MLQPMSGTIMPAQSLTPRITMRGAPLHAPKLFVAGTHRTVAPDETLERIRPALRPAGITRLADVSGLDRMSGLTTVVAVRPNARTLSTSAGKGFTKAAAYVSAAMEALEMHHAEFPRTATVVTSYDDLVRHHDVIEQERLLLSRHSLFNPRRPESWVAGWDFMQSRETWVPYCSTMMVRPPEQQPRLETSFPVNSNGLASGNHILEATCAALYEVIERDAVSCHRYAEHMTGHRAPLVDLETLDCPLVQDLVDRLRSAGMRACARDCTVDTGVPVYVAHLIDERAHHFGVFGGWGAHLDPEIALIRALTEAAQSRVVYISGSRDDVFRLDERQARYEDNPESVAALLRTGTSGEPAPVRRTEATNSFEGDLTVLLDKLARVGIRQTIAADLTLPEFDIPVVRVIAPGLEGYAGHDYVTGPRAEAFAAAASRATLVQRVAS